MVTAVDGLLWLLNFSNVRDRYNWFFALVCGFDPVDDAGIETQKELLERN